MSALHSYEVVKVPHRSIAGDELWTVIETFDGVVMGGDHHWVRERYAIRLSALYELAPYLHGATEKVLRAYWQQYFPNSPLFDSDQEWQASFAPRGRTP